MAVERLEIQVDADVKDAVKALKEVTQSVADIPSPALAAAKALDNLGSSSTGLKNIPTVTREAGQGIRTFGEEAKKAGEKSGLAVFYARDAVLDLGHVARDLPYAASNIAILAGPAGKILSLFNSLKQETGSIKGAFGALAGALTGGGGLVIGAELAISAFTLLAGAFGHGEEKAKEYVDTLNDMDKATLKGKQNSEDDVIKLDLLYKASQNHALSLKQRKSAVEELQSLYPRYFANISQETILNGGAKKSYENLKDSILETAQAQAKFEELKDLSKQLDEINEKGRNASKELAALREQHTRDRPGVDLGAATVGSMQDKEREVGGLADQYTDLNDRIDRLKNTISDPSKIVSHFGDQLAKLPKEQIVKRVREKIDFIAPDKEQALDLFKPNPAMMEKIKQSFEKIIPKNPFKFIFPKDDIDQIIGQLDKMALKSAAVGQGVNILNSAFSSMGTALTSGGNAMQAFFSSLKNSLIQLAVELIKNILLAEALNLLFPGGAAIGGVARKGFGSIFAGLTGFATGGLVTGPTAALIGEGMGTSRSNPEVVAPLDKLKNMIGGAGSGQLFIAESRISGNDIVTAYKRADKRQGRGF